MEQLEAYRHSHSSLEGIGGTIFAGFAEKRQIGFSTTLTLVSAETGRGLSELEQVILYVYVPFSVLEKESEPLVDLSPLHAPLAEQG